VVVVVVVVVVSCSSGSGRCHGSGSSNIPASAKISVGLFPSLILLTLKVVRECLRRHKTWDEKQSRWVRCSCD